MRDGVIEQVGAPHDVYENPSSFFVQDFVGRTIVFDGEVIARDGDRATVRLLQAPATILDTTTAEPNGARVKVAVRPEDISIADGQQNAVGAVEATILDLAYGGDHYDCKVEAAGAEVALRLAKTLPIEPGATLSLQLDPEKTKVWPN